MGVIPCGHRVVVRMLDLKEVDKAYDVQIEGFVLPDVADLQRKQESVDHGVVLAIGPTAWRDFGGEPWCKVGDLVTFAKYAGKRVVDPDDPEAKVQVLNDEDIVCVLKKTTEKGE